jgi:hypothetical protein
MEELLVKYWTQIVGVAVVGAWLVRLEGEVKYNKKRQDETNGAFEKRQAAIEKKQESLETRQQTFDSEIFEKMKQLEIMLARIDERLKQRDAI